MKRLLWICRPNIGENLFATPCMDFLSKNYSISLILPERIFPIFKEYTFISNLIQGGNFAAPSFKLTREALEKISRLFPIDGENYLIYHHDDDFAHIHNHNDLLRFKRWEVLPDKKLRTQYHQYVGDHNSIWMSRTRKYMMKLKLMDLKDTSDYDCTVRVPSYDIPTEKNENIIIYQGSNEHLRQLSTETIEKFFKRLPMATYLVTTDTANKLFKNKNVKYIIINPGNEQTLKDVISLFKSSPKCIICTDSGLTQLALGYKIPMIWLESRIPIQSVIDPQHLIGCKIYRKKSPSCKLECAARNAKFPNELKYGLFSMGNQVNYKNMECWKENHPYCLDYEDCEVDEVLDMIPR